MRTSLKEVEEEMEVLALLLAVEVLVMLPYLVEHYDH
jgi:hypothetical protein